MQSSRGCDNILVIMSLLDMRIINVRDQNIAAPRYADINVRDQNIDSAIKAEFLLGGIKNEM